jgi:predicted RNase H-like HicB family nuclease
MKKLTIIIEASKDSFAAYAEGVEMISGAGDTVAEAKANVEQSIEIVKGFKENVPDILKGKYQVVYKYDAHSLLLYYKPLLTLAGMEKLTGIPQRELQAYSTGATKPRNGNMKKIIDGLHKLGNELLAIK